MRIVSVLLLLSLTVAGCLANNEPTPTDPKGPISDAPAFLLSRGDEVLDPSQWDGPTPVGEWLSVDGRDAREPTVAVDSQGILYYAARDYSGGTLPPATSTQTPIMRSDDGGHTWTDVSPRLITGDREPPRSGDPMVITDPWTDRLFQIELYDLVCNWLVFSDDSGDSWTSNAKGCGSLVVDHQTITAGPPRVTPLPSEGLYPNMVYVCVNQIADSHCARSLDGGLTLATFHIVYPGVDPETQNLCGGIHGHALVGPDGAVYLPREYCGRPYVARSIDDGITWELMDVTGGGMAATSGDPNMAFDAAGNLYYTWMGPTFADQGVWMAVGKSGEGSSWGWQTPSRISHPSFTYANHVSITAGDEGRIGFVYLATTDVPINDDWSNVTWDAYMAVSVDAANAGPATVMHVKVNPDGDAVYRGDCRNIRCGYIREFLDATVAPDGSFWGAFVDACLPEEEARYTGLGDCDTEPGNYGAGNGHLGYVGHLTGVPLYEGERVVSGGG